MSEDENKYKVGQWVSFACSDSIKIGQIEYIRDRTGGYVDLYTTVGVLEQSSVLEVR